MNIEEGNMLIADFMNYVRVEEKYSSLPCFYYPSSEGHMQITDEDFSEPDFDVTNFAFTKYNLGYDSSWDWLLPVYNKLSLEMDIAWEITSKGVRIYSHSGQYAENFDGCWTINCPENVIADAWKAVVEFIIYYNQLNEKFQVSTFS